MSDFLAENNLCGQVILNLVSRGNAIIAELLRLKDYIPKVYRLDSKQDVQKYGDIILDFNYFKISETHEQKIENNEALRDMDEEFRDNHIEIIKRFYLVFESIHTYITDLNHFIDDLNEGMYIHQTLENIFTDIEGKQVMCEALYLYGLMLIVVDAHIDGVVRERLLVSYYRYAPQRQDTKSCIDEVCKLLRDTGYTATKKPSTYPEDYFKRIQIKSIYIDYVVGRLRSDDIYGQVSVYPLPKHRSTALANQASMLHVCLFFSTEILHSQTAIMREIVDKYFPDNWTISLYMGYTVNLVETWDAFKAAKSALNNTLEVVNIKSYATSYGSSVPNLLKTTNLQLKEGNITSENLLKEINNIITTIRECNVTVRWLMLHTVLKPGQTDKMKKSKQLRELVISEAKCEPGSLFKLLLNTAQLELVVRELYKQLSLNKEIQWEELKTETKSRLLELSEVFGGSKPLTRIQKNENLQLWFVEISKQVQSLSQEDNSSSRKIVQLIQALEEVQEFHQLDNNMQVIQFLSETRRYLDQMIRTMNIKEDILINLQIIGDISYAWELIDYYTGIMQLGIRNEPTLVIKLRAVFLKLSSALEIPLLRINQAHSEDLISVSQYYSKELEIYVRKVLHIIPSMMFEKLARIIEMQTTVLKELPTRVDKDKIKDYTQLDERFEFAELTNSISVFSQGMRMMKSTLVGVVCLDPKKLLEDGIRKELVQHISKALHNELIFSAKPKYEELDQKLKNLVRIMDGYKRSFEYIQLQICYNCTATGKYLRRFKEKSYLDAQHSGPWDYINVNGLKIWQEEVTRIINYNVEQECNGFLRYKIHPWQSIYQSRYVPIPIFPSIDQSVNFIGRLATEVIRLTDPRTSVYLDTTVTWYESKTHKQIINKQTIASIASAIEIAGLVGLDRLFSFMIINGLQKLTVTSPSEFKSNLRLIENPYGGYCLKLILLHGYVENKNVKMASWTNIITSIQKEMNQSEEFVNPLKIYQTYVNRCTKIWGDFLENILLVGQLQLLRNLIAFYLNTSCKFNAKNLELSLRSVNKSILMDIKNNRYNPSENLLQSLSSYFDYGGLNQPFNKIYTTSHNNIDHAITVFIFVIAHLHKLFLPQNAGNLVKRTQDQIDGIAFSVGVHTILKQFHSNLNREFIKHLCNYTLQLTKHNSSLKATDLLPEVSAALKFMENYTNYSEESRKFYRECLPTEILHIQQTLCPTSV